MSFGGLAEEGRKGSREGEERAAGAARGSGDELPERKHSAARSEGAQVGAE